MVVFTGKTDTSIYKFAPKTARGAYSFVDNYSMSKKLFDVLNASDAAGNAYTEVLDPIVEIINSRAKENNLEIPDNPDASAASRWSDLDIKKTLTEPGVAYKKQIVNPGLAMVGYSSMDFIGGNDSEGKFNNSLNIMLDFVKQYPEIYPEYQKLTKESLAEEVKAHVLSLKEEAEDIETLSPGFSKMIARFSGSVSGAMEDPLVLGSIGVSFPLLPVVATVGGAAGLSSLTSVMLTEAVIGAGSEAIIQQDVKDWHESLGLEVSLGDMLTAIAAAGVGGAAIPGLFYVGGKAVTLTAKQMASGYEAFKKGGLLKRNPIRDQQEVQLQAQKAQEENNNIYKDVREKTAKANEARAENIAKEKEALNAQFEFRPSNVPNRPKNIVADEVKLENIKKLQSKIKTLAETFPKAFYINPNKLAKDMIEEIDWDGLKPLSKSLKQIKILDEIVSKDVIQQIEKSIAQKQSADIFPWAKTEINRAEATPEELLASDLTNIKVEEALNVIEEAKLFPWIKSELGRRAEQIKNIELEGAKPKPVKPLTSEAETLIAKADDGEIPKTITPELQKIAKENDITIATTDTPEAVINQLQVKRANIVKEPVVSETEIIPSGQATSNKFSDDANNSDAFDDVSEGIEKELPDLEREIIENQENPDEVFPITETLEDGTEVTREVSLKTLQQEKRIDDILEKAVSECAR